LQIFQILFNFSFSDEILVVEWFVPLDVLGGGKIMVVMALIGSYGWGFF